MTWPTAALGDISKIVSGATPKTGEARFWGGEVPWATPKDLSSLDSEFIDRPERSITEDGLRSCAASMLPAHSVLLSSRAPIGLVAINTRPMATNQGFKSLVPDKRTLDEKFLFHWLKANTARLQSLGNGATFKELSKAVVERIEIPLPPLDEQRRIAAILDKADALRRKRKRALDLLDGLTQSIFLDMFGSLSAPPVNIRSQLPVLPPNWNWKLLTDVARLATGHTPDRKIVEYWSGDIPWLSLGDIRKLDGRIALETEERATQLGIDKSSAVLLPIGTVCFSRTASVGFTTLMGRPMATSQDFVNWVCGSEILPEYLLSALINARSELLSLASGSTHRTIYFPTVKRFQVLVPPVNIQRQFVEARRKLIRGREVVEATIPTLDSLLASLQSRAFSGHL